MASKHDYVNYAEIIKSKVSVPSVVGRYLSNVKVVHNRIPCPIHNGTDRNLLIHQNHFYCFVCGEGGDVIRLVRHIFGCSFMDALNRINTDFCVGLPLGTKPSDAERAEMKRSYAERLKKEQEEEVITPELQAMIDKGRQEIKEGKGTLVSSKQELYDLMESL